MADNELGEFLRGRRESVTPAEVGLPTGPRRRTPGLRRAELATLAGVSVEYLTRLEQGRDRRPSARVLSALADALRLTTDERALLGHTAHAADGGVCGMTDGPSPSVRPTIRALLDRLEPTPAAVLNRLGDVLAWNPGYERLVGPLGLLDTEAPNVARFVFTDDRARAAFPDWEHVADEWAAVLKAESLRRDAPILELVEDLTIVAGAPFADRLAAPTQAPRRPTCTRWAHPEVGELRLEAETLTLSAAEDQRLVPHLPADQATTTALARLTNGPANPGPLRVVTG